MASPAQVLANQANAQYSTGPKTAEGKAASSHNAATHGLASPLVVLAHESQAEFDELLECLIGEHQPTNLHQHMLVEQLGITQWQLARAQRLQTAAFEQLAAPTPNIDDPDARIVARMLESNPNTIATLQRYAAQAERSYYKAYRELKEAKLIQHAAEYVGKVDSSLLHRVMNAPMPNHPLYGSQYGNPATPSIPKKANPAAAAPIPPPAKPSLRSQMPENLGLCL